MAAGIALTQKQNAGMVPEHLLGKSVLKMSAVELQEFVRAQLAENPALALSEERPCPVCGWELSGDTCAMCGFRAAGDGESYGAGEWYEDEWKLPGHADDEPIDTFCSVAAPTSLADYLRAQIRSEFDGSEAEAAEAIVDALDDDGYLREPLIEVASRLAMSVPELEAVLERVQRLDPAGVAARSLQECLLIQIGRIRPDGGERDLAETVIRDHWDGVERMKLDRIAEKLGATRGDIEDALLFVREALNPHPADMFRDPWAHLAPRQVSRTAPDIAVRATETGLSAEVADPVGGRLSLDGVYSDLYGEIARKRGACSEADRSHIRDCVREAKCLIEALEFRGSTLARIAQELVRCQAEYFTEGPSALKPLTKKELAQRIGAHESTVCRATQDKTVLLPSGEVVSIELFFDSALPVKELVRQLAAQRLSDGEIAGKLAEAGISIARRTVAKYRDQLRVLPVEYRLAA